MKALLLLCIVFAAVLAQNDFETIDITYENYEQSPATGFLSLDGFEPLKQVCDGYCCSGRCCATSTNCRNGLCNSLIGGTCSGTG